LFAWQALKSDQAGVTFELSDFFAANARNEKTDEKQRSNLIVNKLMISALFRRANRVSCESYTWSHK